MARAFLISFLFTIVTAFCPLSANAAPALSQADAMAAIEHTRPGAVFTWHSIDMGPQRPATVTEASSLGMPYPATVHLIHAQFTANIAGNRRDVTWNYYIFQDYSGHWQAASNAIPGNEESNPY